MRDEKILISRDGPDSNVLKFKPPMVFTTQDADRLVDTLDRVLGELDGDSIAVPKLTLEVRVHLSLLQTSVHNCIIDCTNAHHI